MPKKSVETAKNIDEARRLYLMKPEGYKDTEMAELLGVTVHTSNRYRRQLGCVETHQNSFRYTLQPTETELEFAKTILRRAGLAVVPAYDGVAELDERLTAAMNEEF